MQTDDESIEEFEKVFQDFMEDAEEEEGCWNPYPQNLKELPSRI